MSQPLFSISVLPLFFFIIVIKSKGSNTTTSFSNHCPSYNCSGVLVNYPFWRLDTSTTNHHCGYTGFGLNCSSAGNPILNLSGESYYVREINYTSHTLTLADADVVDQSCPRAQHNLTLEKPIPLRYSTLDLNISFYFHCSTGDSYGYSTLPNSVSCFDSSGSGNVSYVYVDRAEPDDFDWFNLCEKKVVVTVIETEIGRNRLTSGFAEAMHSGFVLDWRTEAECGVCEASEGRCGYDHVRQSFVCYCSDGAVRANHCRGNGLNEPQKIGIGIGVAGTGILLICLVFFIYHRRFRKRYASSLMSRNISSDPSSITDLEKSNIYFGVHIFSYAELEEATNNFDSKKELGDGGFGTVYKGKLRDGRVVAVKRLYENNFKRVEQFMNEVEILTRLRHQNLVTLYGCTSRHCRELLLVYEYIPNGTVADHLHGDRAGKGLLTWKTRMSIAVETASALAFLHASDVIHRDVKTNNILLESNFRVKVADFGLSRLFPTNVTHVSTAPQGTPGYVDPEYHHCYQLTDKSDVFSFGVVLVELISSMPAVDITRHRHEINLSTMAINKIQRRALNELVDPNLGFDSDYKARKMINDVAELAFQCLQNGREMRPSMEEVLEALKEIRRQDYGEENGDDDAGDVPPDDAVLLKSNPLILSPDSVTANWVSRNSTTTNASG